MNAPRQVQCEQLSLAACHGLVGSRFINNPFLPTHRRQTLNIIMQRVINSGADRS